MKKAEAVEGIVRKGKPDGHRDHGAMMNPEIKLLCNDMSMREGPNCLSQRPKC